MAPQKITKTKTAAQAAASWSTAAKNVGKTNLLPTVVAKQIVNGSFGATPISSNLITIPKVSTTNTKKSGSSGSGQVLGASIDNISSDGMALVNNKNFGSVSPAPGTNFNSPQGNGITSVDTAQIRPAVDVNLAGTQQPPIDYSMYIPATQPAAGSEEAIMADSKKRDEQLMKDLLDLQDNRETGAESYAKAQRESGFLQQQKLVGDLTGQLDAIVKKGQAAQLSVVGQGRGIPEYILGGQQAQYARETAIESLPVSAQLAAAQGNLEMAQSNMETLFKIYSDDAEQEYNNKKETYKAVYDFAAAKDKRALEKLDKAEDRKYEEKISLIKSKEAISIEAAKNGASAATLTKIANATDFASAVSSAGSSLAVSSNEITEVNGRKALVNKKTGTVKYLDGSGTDITVRNVNGTPVEGYTLVSGDDPYFIAQKYGTDMAGLKALNTKIVDWNNIQIGTTINVPSKSAGQTQALATILGSGKFTKDQKADLTNAINNGQDPLTVIKNQAKNIMGQTLATDLDKAETAKQQLEKIDKSLKEYYNNGGTTSIFSGNYEKTLNKLGETSDPKIVGIATEIALAMQAYRLAVTGTAASVQEDARIDNVFPGITNGEVLNNARTQATIKSFDTKIDAAYRNTLGSAYDDLKSNSKPPVDPLQNVNSYGDTHPEARPIIIQMQNDGRTIEEISNWVNQFK